MSIYINNQIRNNDTLLSMLLGKKTKNAAVGVGTNYSKKDTVTISSAAQELAVKRVPSGRTHNTTIDSSIDLKSYIDAAKKSNQEALENAGAEINVNAVSYSSTGSAFRAALTEKYSRLAAEAKAHSNPQNYIYQKYYDKGSEYYETNLSDTERQIAYNYEMQMYQTGKINGVNYQDSLFRGIEVSGDVVDNDKLQFERQLVNAQISNILQQVGVDLDTVSENCTFTVDPYTYEITVDGVEQNLRAVMESALNVGDNGKKLFHHIYKYATQDGCNSTQVSAESKMKYEAYQQVYTYTGLKLDQMIEKNGSYYTEDGKNVLELVNNSIDESGDVPKDYKAQMKAWINELVSGIARSGWNNVPDMNLSILLSPNGLKDMYQSIIFQYDSADVTRQWYSVMK
jgi:hypothetical protein